MHVYDRPSALCCSESRPLLLRVPPPCCSPCRPGVGCCCATVPLAGIVQQETLGPSGDVSGPGDEGLLQRLQAVDHHHLLRPQEQAVHVTIATGKLGTERHIAR